VFASTALLVAPAISSAASWKIESTPTTPSNPILNGVSCPSSTACIAVGSQSESGTSVTLAEHWNGTAWAIVSTPHPTGSTSSYLFEVFCTSSTACTAVGQYTNSKAEELTLAERWNGTAWAIQTTPNPTGSTHNKFQGVSCTSTTACTAVGYGTGALAERWNGTEWAIQTTPSPTNIALRSVSCTASTVCNAVGENLSTGLTASERWNGTEWVIRKSVNPTGFVTNGLEGVSCGEFVCSTVGYSVTSTGEEQTLTELSALGASWELEETPHLISDSLEAISCVFSPNPWCVSVGQAERSSGGVTLAENFWNGSWTVMTTLNPSGATSSALRGVSCTSSTACTAVGRYSNGTGAQFALVERYS
jgi:hypothetical protein